MNAQPSDLSRDSPSGSPSGSLSVPAISTASAASGEAEATWGRLPLEPETAIRSRRALMLMSIRDVTDREPLAQEIFDEIAIDIVEGRLRPGDSLNSVDLSRRFGTSRTPVREALAELERHGVMVVPPRRRPYVAHATLKQVKDIYELRANLFSLVSELIVDNCPDERLAGLWTWQRALEDDVARGAIDDYFWHNVGFRLVEVGLSGNGELQRTLHALGLRTLQFRHLSLSQPGRIERSAADHRRLLLAYEERDKIAATGMTRTLIMAGYRTIERYGLVGSDRDGPGRDEQAPGA
jgi:DNA-binding GntR family transcriptional regulator